MKKILCLILNMLLLVSLAACAAGESATTTAATEAAAYLKVGYSKVSIVPKTPLALSSTEQNTYTAVYEDVFMTCIAITDEEGETILMFTTDISYCSRINRETLIKAAEKATGVPGENMFFSCTHNHSGLDPSGAAMKILESAIVESSTAALADRSAATLYAGTTQTEGMNFIRHYQTEDGYWVGDGYYSPTGTHAHTSEREADPTVSLIRFDREGKDPILMMNWQAHGVYSYLQEFLCADYIGSLRTTVEEETNCLFAFFQGAAGNVNPVSNLSNKYPKTLAGMTNYGKELAHQVIPAISTLKPMNGDDLEIVHTTKVLDVRQDTGEMIMAAADFRRIIEAGGTRVEAIAECGGLIRGDQGAEWLPYRSSFGDTVDADISAIRLGDVSFVVVPYEMFDDTGVDIRERSPFDITFILGYTNGRLFYVPSAACIEHGCYEWECGLFVKGTAELLADEYVNLLNQLNDAK